MNPCTTRKTVPGLLYRRVTVPGERRRDPTSQIPFDDRFSAEEDCQGVASRPPEAHGTSVGFCGLRNLPRRGGPSPAHWPGLEGSLRLPIVGRVGRELRARSGPWPPQALRLGEDPLDGREPLTAAGVSHGLAEPTRSVVLAMARMCRRYRSGRLTRYCRPATAPLALKGVELGRGSGPGPWQRSPPASTAEGGENPGRPSLGRPLH